MIRAAGGYRFKRVDGSRRRRARAFNISRLAQYAQGPGHHPDPNLSGNPLHRVTQRRPKNHHGRIPTPTRPLLPLTPLVFRLQNPTRSVNEQAHPISSRPLCSGNRHRWLFSVLHGERSRTGHHHPIRQTRRRSHSPNPGSISKRPLFRTSTGWINGF